MQVVLLLDSEAIVVPDRVKRWCVGRAALIAADEKQEMNQSGEMHVGYDDSTTPDRPSQIAAFRRRPFL
jgi:hypothetical protein